MTPAGTETTAPTPLPRGGATAAVAFVAVAVVALAVVPMVMGGRADRAQREIEEVLEPARLLGVRLSLVQARQMSLFQAFLLTGDPDFRSPYGAALAEARDITAELQGLIGGMDLEVRERLARLSSVAGNWHLVHQPAFDSEEVRLQMVEDFEAEQARYEALQGATLELERILRVEMDGGRARARQLRALQGRISTVLLLVGLGATLAVFLVGNRLRVLAAEADARRRDAVRARREMDALLEATGDGVLGMDLEGKALSLNRAGCELLGYHEGELTGRDVHETLWHHDAAGEPRPREASPVLRALAAPPVRGSGEDALWRRDGTPLPVQWSLAPLMDGLVVRGAVLTFTDLTAIREKEEALRRAVRVREEVVSVVSHDLRNPLGVVSGAADLLLDLPLGEADRRKQADIIRRSAERMTRLIENLLDVARIEAGALVVRPVVQDVGELLAEVAGFFEPQAEGRAVTFRTDVADGLPPVLADPDRVQQALANLLGNALRFAPYGSTVTLGAHAAGPHRVALTVRDEGPGIPVEDQARLFDRFWQASRHDRTGSGLGLAIVWGIAQAHGGAVEVSSEPGKGALFTLLLPVPPGAGSRSSTEGGTA
ncbi:MAG: hypothetical protein AMXMBFR53_44670 [Gemmatimonadota bacterium]